MLFSCPSRRAKHAKNSMITDWMTDEYRGGEDERSLSQYSTSGSLGAAQRTRKAVVLQTYKAQLANEMSVTEGEVIHIMHHAKNWAYVINSEGQKGYIPYSYCGEAHSTLTRQNARPSKAPAQLPLNSASAVAANGTAGGQRWGNARQNGEMPVPRRRLDDNTSIYSASIDMLDFADTISLRSSVDPDVGKRLGTGVYMADILPFFKVPYGRSVVLFDFKGGEENDLDVSRGTDITVLNQDDPGWLWVRTDDRREGFVPRTYICQCGCTNIHEQIVESLQETMQRQEEQHLEQERAHRRQLRQHDTAGDIAEEDEEDAAAAAAAAAEGEYNLTEYPEYDYARFQSGRGMPAAPPGPRTKAEPPARSGGGGDGNQEVQYSVQKAEAEACGGTSRYTYASVLPKSERSSKVVPDEQWSGGGSSGGEGGSNPHFGQRDIKLRIVSTVTGPSEVNSLDVDINDVVYVTEENWQVGSGSGWLFVYSPDVDRYGYVPESAVQSM